MGTWKIDDFFPSGRHQDRPVIPGVHGESVVEFPFVVKVFLLLGDDLAAYLHAVESRQFMVLDLEVPVEEMLDGGFHRLAAKSPQFIFDITSA